MTRALITLLLFALCVFVTSYLAVWLVWKAVEAMAFWG